MCNAIDKTKYICSDSESGYICPMRDKGLCGKSISELTHEDWTNGEKMIMAWAAEHPEPVYPTWARWLESMGLIEIRWNGPVLASMRIGVDDTDYIPIVKKLLENIPADIAQKIGIPPVEVHK
jgi:hypothetical protein